MKTDPGMKPRFEPNIVPLCDILLVLMIIFMVITPAFNNGIDILLPSSDRESGNGTILTIEKDLTLILNDTPISISKLGATLRERFSTRMNKCIYIRADITVPYHEVTNIIDIAMASGAEYSALITQPYHTGQ